jgi:hypothetical protein
MSLCLEAGQRVNEADSGICERQQIVIEERNMGGTMSSVYPSPGSDQPDTPQLIPQVHAAGPDAGTWDMPIDILPNLGKSLSSPIPTPEPTQDAANSPEEPVRTFFDGLNRMNVDDVLSAFAPSTRLLARPIFLITFNQANKNGFSATFNNMDYSILSQTENNAIVYAGGTVTIFNSQDNSQMDSDFELDIPVTYINNHWYISLNLQTLYKFLKEEYGY